MRKNSGPLSLAAAGGAEAELGLANVYGQRWSVTEEPSESGALGLCGPETTFCGWRCL